MASTPTIKFQCSVCGVPASQKCGGCQNVVYCGKDHQKLDWKKGHKNLCKCYQLVTNEKFGRHLIATRDIKPGEIILRESPLVIGPKISSNLVCLGCHKRIMFNEIKEVYKCSKCNWPLCTAACEKSAYHRPECDLMERMKFKFTLNTTTFGARESGYCVIAPLRILLLKKSHPLVYEKIIKLESHLDERLTTTLYTILKANIVTFIQTILDQTDYDQRAIMESVAILDTNAFEIRLPINDIPVRGLYEIASMMSHDCKSNTKHIFDSNYQFILIATDQILKGQPITVTYTHTLRSTAQRRAHLKQSKCFDCCCKRCCDPTEFEMYVGSITCTKCKICKMIAENPLDYDTEWKCLKCDHRLPALAVNNLNDAILKEIAGLDRSSPIEFESFLVKYKHALHETNTHVLQVKYALTQMYGQLPGCLLADLTDKQLQRKIDLSRELLQIADILEPGLTQFRGNLLYDQQSTLLAQIKRKVAEKVIDHQQYKTSLVEVLALLKEAHGILGIDSTMRLKLGQQITSLENEFNNL